MDFRLKSPSLQPRLFKWIFADGGKIRGFSDDRDFRLSLAVRGFSLLSSEMKKKARKF